MDSRVEIVRTEIVHTGSRFDLAVHTLRNAEGREFDREYLTHPGSVVLMPVLGDGQIVLIRNYRHAVNEWLLEAPAGTLRRGEDVALAAARELREETGYRAGRLTELLSFYPAPGALAERMSLYLAEDLVPGEPEREFDEEMTVEIHPLRECLEMAIDGRIQDGKTILGLWRIERMRDGSVDRSVR